MTHLAQMIAADHRAMDDALLASAKARGTPIAPAWTLAPANTPPLSELAKLEGATFDGPFVNWLVENEARAVAAATDAATQAKAAGDTALAARVERAIPRLRDHVASAQRLKDELAAQQANRGGSPP